ncbi:glycosyl hydrolase [Sphingomonas suaedae]|uniref:Beta-xylanase n=1 Tax=Sphingomonas suaedae TaxID=2599297 RepID=A0A518RGT7_9SPHN|nr:endo-1,4-beta-xylanase [Sphingomonas suaedae]QDX26634.1 glycosyl hydrolase [Sphingomonas suaedae]
MTPTRRQTLSGLAALPLVAALPARARNKPATIQAAALASGRRFGSAVAWAPPGADAGSFNNPAYAEIVARECGLIVPENEMKWQSIRPSATEYRFDRLDAMVTWARGKGIGVRGHTLLWHRPKWFPAWLNNHDFGTSPKAAAEKLLGEHVRTVMGRYKETITSWDVVNEAVDPETSGLVETSLSKAFGGVEPALDFAFHIARAQAPDAELVYNDYMSWEPGNEKHRAGVLKLLEGFRKRGVPVDTLGIQSHIEMFTLDPRTGLGPRQEREWRAFIDEAVGMGYKLMITELDVKDNALPGDPAVRDAGVVAYLRAYMELMLSYPQLRDVLAWGMVDKYSWLQGFSPRKDGLPLRCCPYDSAFRPKPMRDELIRLFAAAAPAAS